MASLGFHRVKSNLCAPDAGATLSTDGHPFFLEQMKRKKIVRMNKASKLRIDKHFNKNYVINERCHPSNGNYILERMNENQKMMERFRTKYQLF